MWAKTNQKMVQSALTMPTATAKPKGFLFQAPWLLIVLLLAMSGFESSLFLTEEPGIHVIVLDAGHGGKDPGNLGTGRYKDREKDIALEVTKKVGRLIEEQLKDVKVVYTRTGDSFVELQGRTAIANRAKADLFISIHCDAFTDPSAHGSCTIVMGKDHGDENMRVAMQENSVITLEDNYEEKYQGFDPSKPETYIALTLYQNAFLEQSISLATKIQSQFRERVQRKDRGVKQQPLYVTSRTTMPAVLIELGFLTNRPEEDFLNSAQGQDYMASAIFRAVRDYKSEREAIEKRSAGKNPLPLPKAEDQPAISSGTKETPSRSGSAENKFTAPQPEKPQVYFAIQLATSAEKKSTDPSNFKGLEGVELLEENGLYKYLQGQYSNYQEAKDAQDLARKNGFSGAFVVGFVNGKKVSVTEALKLAK